MSSFNFNLDTDTKSSGGGFSFDTKTDFFGGNDKKNSSNDLFGFNTNTSTTKKNDLFEPNKKSSNEILDNRNNIENVINEIYQCYNSKSPNCRFLVSFSFYKKYMFYVMTDKPENNQNYLKYLIEQYKNIIPEQRWVKIKLKKG
jgi:hypothetical protein